MTATHENETAGVGAATRRARESWEAWHAERDAGLARPYDWLSVVGYHWVTATSPDEVSAAVGDVPGRWWVDGGVLHARAVPDDGLALVPESGDDAEGRVIDGVATAEVGEAGARRFATFGPPSDEGGVLVEVLRRGGYYALRLRDPEAPARREFAGVPTYDYDPSWVVDVELVPYPEPRPVRVGAAAPGLEQVARTVGEVVVRRDGREHRLVATAHGAAWSLAFSDATSGVTSSAWRAVAVDGQPHSGRGVVDFNRSVNYPYAFSDVGTCPRPVVGNRLDLEVRAGERAPAGRTGVPPAEGGPTALPGPQLLP